MRTLMLLLAVGLVGCGVHVTPQVIATSFATGRVTVAYTHPANRPPVVNWGTATRVVQKHCSAWGYSSVYKFGRETRKCHLHSSYRCLRYKVTAQYQCIR